MKNILTIAFLMFIGVMAYSQDTQALELKEEATEKVEGPIMKFEEKLVNYGTIVQGSDPLRVFNFTNMGTEPLIINKAKGSCGCTVPSYPKEPVMPGESGVIEVRYDTKRLGSFKKTVRLHTNEAGKVHVLTIKGKTYKKPVEKSVPASEENLFDSEKD